jgi:hypothetical protein
LVAAGERLLRIREKAGKVSRDDRLNRLRC